MPKTEKKGESFQALRKEDHLEQAALAFPCMLAQMAIKVWTQSVQILAKMEDG